MMYVFAFLQYDYSYTVEAILGFFPGSIMLQDDGIVDVMIYSFGV
jgi:hypothetical protein